MLFAHNARAEEGPTDIPGVTSGGVIAVGALLQQALGDPNAVIGTTFDRAKTEPPPRPTVSTACWRHRS